MLFISQNTAVDLWVLKIVIIIVKYVYLLLIALRITGLQLKTKASLLCDMNFIITLLTVDKTR